MSKVYVVQRQLKRDDNGEMVDRFDLVPAEDYGELEFLLEPKEGPFRPVQVIRKLHNKLKFFTASDYILLIGNPCLIGWTVAIAAHYSKGSIKLLQWHAMGESYLVVDSRLFLPNGTCPPF